MLFLIAVLYSGTDSKVWRADGDGETEIAYRFLYFGLADLW